MPTLASPSLLQKAKLFRGFAEPSRLLIVEALKNGARTVSEICEATGLTQPNTSNHLACLLGCGLVDRQQRGRFAYYRLADDRVEALLALGDEISSGVTGSGACCPVCGSDEWLGAAGGICSEPWCLACFCSRHRRGTRALRMPESPCGSRVAERPWRARRSPPGTGVR